MSFEVIKQFETKPGLQAAILKVYDSHLCGYVEVSKESRLHGVKCSDPCEFIEPPLNDSMGGRGVIPLVLAASSGRGGSTRPDVAFDVHGSITFSGGAYWLGDDLKGWWFGFDLNHYGDSGLRFNEPYVASECEKLADQLALHEPSSA